MYIIIKLYICAPLLQLSVEICSWQLLTIPNQVSHNYSDIRLIEGIMVNVICPPGLVLNGTMSVACARNGEWEPDPQDVKCIEG